MPNERRPMDGACIGLMTFLCMIWGLQQVAIKAVAPDVAPVLQVAMRAGLSALLLALYVRVRGGSLTFFRGPWRTGLISGLLFSGEFFFVGEGLRFTAASHMAVFLYTAPIFTALGLHALRPEERLSPLQWMGILLAFGGIVLTFAGRPGGAVGPAGASGADMLWGDFLGLLAGASYGATTVLVRCSSLSMVPATQTLFYQLAVSFVVLLPMAVLTGQGHCDMTPLAWGGLLFQGVVVSFASYLAWFALLLHYLASRLAVFSLLSPVFGVLFGVLLLGERLDVSFVLGSAAVLAGVAVVNGGHVLLRGLARGARLFRRS
ncbi:MAG: DMT family transporter [Desulfovibrionaceae bacterium]|nr:DMT family transporter [Desulfovibrionaceae bacterium]